MQLPDVAELSLKKSVFLKLKQIRNFIFFGFQFSLFWFVYQFYTPIPRRDILVENKFCRYLKSIFRKWFKQML